MTHSNMLQKMLLLSMLLLFSSPGKDAYTSMNMMFGNEKINSLCLEKRAFYRAVSGLHASITIHLSANYPVKVIIQGILQ